MSCANWEIDIALYAGGDLGGEQAARLESHLEGCAECRGLLEELREGGALLSELREDPMEDAMVAQVRRRVMAQVSEARPRVATWKLAVAAALVLAAILAIPRQARKPRQIDIARLAPPPVVQPAASTPVVLARTPAAHHVVRRRRLRTPPQPTAAPLLVQFVTDDPNVVIYWLVDQKPEGD